MGHKAGIEAIRPVAEACDRLGIRVLTVFAFSTENWNRPRDEVETLMELFSETIRREVETCIRRGVEMRFCGRLEELSPALREQMRQANDRTRVNARAVLNVAVNYGGRQEIVDAVQEMAAAGVDLRRLDEAMVAAHLYTRDLPDPDLIIRTAGEVRLSNFLLWQAAYAEYWSTDVYWPDFDVEKFREALGEYGRRKRRFGGLTSIGSAGS